MEKYLAMASVKCNDAGLKCSQELKSSWTKLVKKSITVDGRGKMNVLRTRGDGNCLFRAVGIALTGLDDDCNRTKGS